jgi:S-(hydroxymethyl)glutathione dehydrogenase/alcohol dehydrogenase
MPAVVTRSIGRCEIEEVRLRSLGGRDVLVRIDASGICHSDRSVCDGSLPSELPAVLGHEGAGTVLEVGAGVTTLRPGDRVVLAAVAPCGRCWHCGRGEPYLCGEVRRQSAPAFLAGDRPLRGVSGLGTLTDALVVDERAAVRVDTSLADPELAVIGCAVLTGAGAVLNIATARAGDSVLVVGAGGVGLAAVLAARVLCAEVLAIDPSRPAQAAARRCGATRVAAPDSPGLDEDTHVLTGGRGFDITVDCVGSAASFQLAWRMTRRGGHVVVVGVGAPGVQIPVPLAEVPLSGRRLSGCVYGASAVHRDIPLYVAMAESGRLSLHHLVGRTIGLTEAPEAVLRGALGPGRTVVVQSR